MATARPNLGIAIAEWRAYLTRQYAAEVKPLEATPAPSSASLSNEERGVHARTADAAAGALTEGPLAEQGGTLGTVNVLDRTDNTARIVVGVAATVAVVAMLILAYRNYTQPS